MNCTYFLDDSSWPSEFGYRYNCFKQDPYFGYGTIGIMFLPGYLFAFLLAYGFKQKGKIMKAYAMILISPICSAMFPFLLIIVKVREKNLRNQFHILSGAVQCQLNATLHLPQLILFSVLTSIIASLGLSYKFPIVSLLARALQ